MELIQRNHCVFSKKEDLEPLYSFKNFPVFMGCVTNPADQDLRADMNWWISRSTGSIQLNPLIPLDILYADSHGSGSTGRLWAKHHQAFAEFIRDYSVANALEIGAGHGILAQNYLKLVPNAIWTAVEPNPGFKPYGNLRIIRGMFDSDFTLPHPVDAVVHSHVIEHLYEPRELVANIAQFLRTGQLQLFSIPRLEVMLARKYTNCINFEHTTFMTEDFVEYILLANQFDIIKKQYFQEDHSVFYACKKRAKAISQLPVPNGYAKNKELYTNYVKYHLDLINALHRKIAAHNGPVFLFGGHVFSQYLIGFGLDESRIDSILDNDQNKQGKRLYGTDRLVQSPNILRHLRNPAVILKAGVYNQEIKEDIIQNINPAVIFWDEFKELGIDG